MGMHHIPDSTNGEEATHVQVGRLGHQLSFVQGMIAAKQVDDYKHGQAELNQSVAYSSRDHRQRARDDKQRQVRKRRKTQRAARIAAATDGLVTADVLPVDTKVEIFYVDRWLKGKITDHFHVNGVLISYDVKFWRGKKVYRYPIAEVRAVPS